MTHEEYLRHDATALAAQVRKGAVTPTELLELALRQMERVNPSLNAVVRLMEDEARARAAEPPGDGPFAGVPFLVKDLLSNVKGHPTSAGSRLLRDVPVDHDSEVVRRLRAAGVVLLGKTNLPEWGLVPFTEPEVWGPCRNPWDLTRTPGGSSGGSAAAVAAGIVPVAGGGDGGGSIRIPASCCGLFGLKPTRGRVPTGPDYGEIWGGAVVEHVLTRSVRDSAGMLDAIQGEDPGAPYVIPPPAQPYTAALSTPPPRLRIAWTTRPMLGGRVAPDCVEAVHDAAELLSELGHEVTEDAPQVDGDALARAFLLMVSSELAADLEDAARLLGRRPRRGELEPATWALALLGRAIPAEEYASALRTMDRTARQVGPFFQRFDVLLTPTLAAPPVKIGALTPSRGEEVMLRILGAFGSGRLIRAVGLLEQAAEHAFDFTPWTPVFNVTGQPAMSVPLHWNASGLPIGTHFVGRFGAEDVLFRLAAQLEEARPWFHRLPPIAHGSPEEGASPGS